MPIFDHFNILAPIYDRAITLNNIEQLIKHLDFPTGGSLIDAGGGTGRVAKALTANYSDVYVADLSYKMLLQAVKKGGLNALQSHTEALPFPDEAFDSAIVVDALHHVFNQELTASELWRVVKIGGRIVIEEPDIRKLGVKMIAIVEKLALMRSKFISPVRIANLFNNHNARSNIFIDGINAWVVIEKFL